MHARGETLTKVAANEETGLVHASLPMQHRIYNQYFPPRPDKKSFSSYVKKILLAKYQMTSCAVGNCPT